MTPLWLISDLQKNSAAFSFSAALAITGPNARFLPKLSLSFIPYEVLSATYSADIWELTIGLPGLYGTHSPLPTSYTEDLISDELSSDIVPLRRCIYDVIHQRIFSALASVISRNTHHHQQDKFIFLLLGLANRPTDALIPSDVLLRFSGLRNGRCHGADSIERVLSEWGQVRCEIEECIPLWTQLPAIYQTQLGALNSTLGNSCVVGEWFVNRATAFRIMIGPVHWDAIDAWLPGSKHLEEFIELTKLFNDSALDMEIVVQIEGSSIHCPTLGHGRLGRDMRIHGTPSPHRREIVYRSSSYH